MDRPFLIGEKIYLRPLDLDDLNGDYIQWVNDEHIINNLGTTSFPKTKQQLEDYYRSMTARHDMVFLAIVDKSNNQHVGNIKLGPIDWISRRTNYGRMLSKECWGKGFGSEALSLIIKYTFEKLNLNRIIDFAAASNTQSIKSNQKSGMDVEGTIKEMSFKNGKYEDVVILGLTKKRYFEKKEQGLIK